MEAPRGSTFHIGRSDPVNGNRRRSTPRQSTGRPSSRLARGARPRQPLQPHSNNGGVRVALRTKGRKHLRDTENDDAATRSKKKRKVSPLEIQPSFAMMPVGFQQGHVLDTGYGGEWEFNLGQRISQIHEQCPNLDIYIVGYRLEERPGVAEDGFREAFPDAEKGKRINLPYFAVHCLPRELDEPDTIVLEDIGEVRNYELMNLNDLSLYWKQVAAFEDGPAVAKLLQSRARTTATAQRAGFLPSAHVGGRVYFPQRPKRLRNHGEDFSFKDAKGEDFPFDDSIWDETKQNVKSAITDGIPDHDKKRFWLDFMMTEDTNDWLEKVLPVSLYQFYDYYGKDINKEATKDDVQNKLRDVFIAFRSKLMNDNREFLESEDALKKCKNFKIYPENKFLKDYLSKGRLNKLSKWTPGNDEIVVYPTVEHKAKPEQL